jgi:hypothetical protein
MKNNSDKFTVALILILLNFSVHATELLRYDLKYFILGTVDDYSGRNLERIPADYKDCYITYYYLYQEPLRKFVDTLFKEHNKKAGKKLEYRFVKDNRDTTKCHNYNDFIFLCSSELAEFINNHYVFKDTGAMIENRGMTYPGELKDICFPDRKAKLSYLAGCYAECGTIDNENRFGFNFSNSIRKFENTVQLIKQLGCDTINAKTVRTRPVSRTFRLAASEEVARYLKPLVSLVQNNK